MLSSSAGVLAGSGARQGAAAPLVVFSKSAKAAQRERTGGCGEFGASHAVDADFLKRELAAVIDDRMDDVLRDFPTVLDLGSAGGALSLRLAARKDVNQVIAADSAQALMGRDLMLALGRELPKDSSDRLSFINSLHPRIEHVVLPEAEDAIASTLGRHAPFDAVVSNLALHWMNDLPGVLSQILHLLKPDGLFLGTMYGGETLRELRIALQLAETERDGGISPHVSPLAESHAVGNLLTAAGYSLVMVDVDTVTVHYADAFKLMDDLQLMGENNAVLSSRGYVSKDVLMAAAAIYNELFYDAEAGGVRATFDVLNLVGWRPDASQPQPLARGSATASLKDLGQGSS